MGRREAVNCPRQSSRPGAVGSIALLSGFAQKRARGRIENALVSSAAVNADEVLLRGAGMFQSNLAQGFIARRAACPKNDADIHHDVDKQRIGAEEGCKIAAALAPEGE